jgi:hypothetical protein
VPVFVEEDPKDRASRAGPRGDVWKRIQGASYQAYHAKTYTDGPSVSETDEGTTTYRVEIPRCSEDCQCLIVVSVTGEIKGFVAADASDFFLGKARASADAKLWSSLGVAQAQLAIVSGDGAESYEASGELTAAPRVNVKVVGKVGDGPLDKISAYSCGPVSFNACYADFSVTAEGAVNGYINSHADASSYADATILITHKCKISAYCVCNGERSLILEWSRDWREGSMYTRRSAKDEEYEKKLKDDTDKLGSNTGKSAPTTPPRQQARMLRELAKKPRPARHLSDGLAKTRDLFERELSKMRPE